MKTTITFLFFALGAFFNLNVLHAQPVLTGAQISVNKEMHDYGSIKFEANGDCEFVITNNGNEPLILSSVKGSCSCTVPVWPTEPIAPGETAIIKVTYNTHNPGPINKSVTILSNAVNEPVKVVKITGTVLPAPEGVSPVEKSFPEMD